MHHSFSCHSPSVRCLWTVSATQSNHRQSLVLASLSEHRGTPSTQYCIVHDTTIMIHHDISWSSPLGSKLEAGQINTVCGRIQGWKLALSNKQRCTMPINAWYSKCKLRLEATGTALMKHFASASDVKNMFLTLRCTTVRITTQHLWNTLVVNVPGLQSMHVEKFGLIRWHPHKHVVSKHA